MANARPFSQTSTISKYIKQIKNTHLENITDPADVFIILVQNLLTQQSVNSPFFASKIPVSVKQFIESRKFSLSELFQALDNEANLRSTELGTVCSAFYTYYQAMLPKPLGIALSQCLIDAEEHIKKEQQLRLNADIDALKKVDDTRNVFLSIDSFNELDSNQTEKIKAQLFELIRNTDTWIWSALVDKWDTMPFTGHEYKSYFRSTITTLECGQRSTQYLSFIIGLIKKIAEHNETVHPDTQTLFLKTIFNCFKPIDLFNVYVELISSKAFNAKSKAQLPSLIMGMLSKLRDYQIEELTNKLDFSDDSHFELARKLTDYFCEFESLKLKDEEKRDRLNQLYKANFAKFPDYCHQKLMAAAFKCTNWQTYKHPVLFNSPTYYLPFIIIHKLSASCESGIDLFLRDVIQQENAFFGDAASQFFKVHHFELNPEQQEYIWSRIVRILGSKSGTALEQMATRSQEGFNYNPFKDKRMIKTLPDKYTEEVKTILLRLLEGGVWNDSRHLIAQILYELSPQETLLWFKNRLVSKQSDYIIRFFMETELTDLTRQEIVNTILTSYPTESESFMRYFSNFIELLKKLAVTGEEKSLLFNTLFEKFKQYKELPLWKYEDLFKCATKPEEIIELADCLYPKIMDDLKAIKAKTVSPGKLRTIKDLLKLVESHIPAQRTAHWIKLASEVKAVWVSFSKEVWLDPNQWEFYPRILTSLTFSREHAAVVYRELMHCISDIEQYLVERPQWPDHKLTEFNWILQCMFKLTEVGLSIPFDQAVKFLTLQAKLGKERYDMKEWKGLIDIIKSLPTEMRIALISHAEVLQVGHDIFVKEALRSTLKPNDVNDVMDFEYGHVGFDI